jgi:hypothetical protein
VRVLMNIIKHHDDVPSIVADITHVVGVTRRLLIAVLIMVKAMCKCSLRVSRVSACALLNYISRPVIYIYYNFLYCSFVL